MARIARVVVPGVPHHVTQRGNRGQRTFFTSSDYRKYLALAAEYCREFDTEVWAYCLMPNHVHLILVPAAEDGLWRPLARTHLRYTKRINIRNEWHGHVWQDRYYSVPMDERHLLAAVRYVERNPVAGGLCDNPDAWPWSSAQAHISGKNDDLVHVRPMLDRVSDWRSYLAEDSDPRILDALQKNLRTGRPLGDAAFVGRIEKLLGRNIRPGKAGRPREERKKRKGRKLV